MEPETRRKSKPTYSKVLHATALHFLNNGYSGTRIDEISRSLGYKNNNVFFRTFPSKEAALLALMPYVLKNQLLLASSLLGENNDKILWYAFDIAVEHYIAESSESLRDLYLASYSIPQAADLIYKMMAPKLLSIFGDNFKGYEEKDFFELDIASAGVIRGFMSVKCDIYFTLKDKIRKSIESTLRIFRVPEEKIEQVVSGVLEFEITDKLSAAIEQMIHEIENGSPVE